MAICLTRCVSRLHILEISETRRYPESIVDKTLDNPNTQLAIRFRANSMHGPSNYRR